MRNVAVRCAALWGAVLCLVTATSAYAEPPIQVRQERLARTAYLSAGALLTLAGGYALATGITSRLKAGECRSECATGYSGRAGTPAIVYGAVGLGAGLGLLGLGLNVHLELRRDYALASIGGRF